MGYEREERKRSLRSGFRNRLLRADGTKSTALTRIGRRDKIRARVKESASEYFTPQAGTAVRT